MISLHQFSQCHHHWWEQFKHLKEKQQLPQAILLIGPQHLHLNEFAKSLAMTALCSHANAPCNSCQSCKLVNEAEHPDLSFLEPEKKFHPIKIDQIRSLQETAFISPQISNRRVIVINPAEDMNTAAANALLKILEEPPTSVFFILIVEQLSTLLPTIISRCQLWQFFEAQNFTNEYLEIGSKYADGSSRGLLLRELPSIIQDLDFLINKQLSIVDVAKKWTNYEINELIWLLYLIQSQLIYYHFFKPKPDHSWTAPLLKLTGSLSPFLLFNQMDRIFKIKRQLQNHMSMNAQLLLENFLLGYLE